MKVLYLINYAGKAGIEKYVENLVRLGPGAGVEPYFAYAVAGPLSEKMAAAGVPALQFSMEWKRLPQAARELADWCREQGVEVIHAQCPRENIVALLARRRLPGCGWSSPTTSPAGWARSGGCSTAASPPKTTAASPCARRGGTC